jgi:hypothetical protein
VMTIFDLVLLLAVLGCILALFALCYLLLRRQWRRARRISLTLGSFLALYTVVLLSVSLLSQERVLAMHQDRCFDDWCLSVERVVQRPTLGAPPTIVTARSEFYLVTVHVSSRAKAITQRAPDAQVSLLDASGQRSDPSPAGQQALDATGQEGSRSRVHWLPAAHLHAPSSSTCPKTHRILPWWSPMACSQISSSSEVSRASFTNRRSSNSKLVDEINHQILMFLGGEARRPGFIKRLERLANLLLYHQLPSAKMRKNSLILAKHNI